MNKKRGIIILLVSMLVSASLVSGSFSLGNESNSIDVSYAPGDILRGWINISFQNEPAGSILATNFGGGVNISELIERNGGDYTCLPSDCEEDYFLSNWQNSRTLLLDYEKQEAVGFNISGKVLSLTNFSIGISIDNPPSCISPVEIEIPNILQWRAWKFDSSFICTYEDGMGCFSYSIPGSEKNVTTIPYCENIFLVESGKFRIGAWLRKSGTGDLTMELVGLGGGSALASCKIPENAVTSSGGEVSCVIEYNNTGMQEYFVCVRATNADAYSIKTEATNPCGFFAVNIPPSASQQREDYAIFARGARFDKIGSFTLDQKEYESLGYSGEIASDIENNLRARYWAGCESCSINCTPEGCKIPMKIRGFERFNVTLSNLNIKYLTELGEYSANRIYNASLQQPRISSGFLALDLSYANFSIPSSSGYGNKSLVISLEGREVLNKLISVARVPVIKGVSPRFLPAGVSTKFTADVSSPSNSSIVSYSWDFGDGTTEESATNSVSHAYTATGIYTLEIDVQDSQGYEAGKEFSIIAGSAREIANSTLKKYRERVNNITRQIESEPEWIKKVLKKDAGIEEIDLQLRELEKKYSIASGDEEYSNVMLNLSEMNVPIQIKKGSSVSFPVLVNPDEINLGHLATMGAGDMENIPEEETDSYREAIISWLEENVEMGADSYAISAYYDDEIKLILNYFNLKITAKSPSDDESYLIIGDAASFAAESPRELEGASGLRLSKLEDKNIEFLVSGDKNPLELAVYLSPEFKKLDIKPAFASCNSNKKCEKDLGENWKNCRSDCKPWGWVIFYLVMLIILAFIAYIVLQEWYKRKYESHLFRNRNDLYNIVNFIHNAASRGMQKPEIEKNLKHSGWSSEQVSYAFKKVSGKRIGVPFEIGFNFNKSLFQKQEKAFKPQTPKK